MNIIEAVERNDTDAVERCIAKNEDVNAKDNNGYTALMKASQYGYSNIVDLLLQSGCKHPDGFGGWTDVNAKNNYGDTALMLASRNGHSDTAELLLQAGCKHPDGFGGCADVNAKNIFNDTALMLASRYGHTDTAKLLLLNGADVNAKNNNGDTALILALRNGHSDIAERIVSVAMSASCVLYTTVALSSFIPRQKNMNARDYAGLVANVISLCLGCAIRNATFGRDVQRDVEEILGGRTESERKFLTQKDTSLLTKFLKSLRSIDYTDRLTTRESDEKASPAYDMEL